MLFRQRIAGCQNVVCYIAFRLVSNSLLIFINYLLEYDNAVFYQIDTMSIKQLTWVSDFLIAERVNRN